MTDEWPCLACGEPVQRRESPILGGPFYIHSSQIDIHFPVRSPSPHSPYWAAQKLSPKSKEIE